jgi:type VII secretion protein EccB
MQSRRDQVQAYFFVVGRLVAALTHGKPDILEPPNRRLSNGTVMGFLLAALIVAVVGIIGLFVPGKSQAWRQPGVIVMAQESGARFVYLDDQLRPVLNYTSARLVLGQAAAPIVTVSQNSLAGVPVGQPIGIPGAPDALPAPDHLIGGPWTVCVQAAPNAAAPPLVTLRLADGPGTAMPGDQGIMVSAPDRTRYLIWQGHRYRMSGQVAGALGYGGARALPVPAVWLSPVPAGRDLVVPKIPGIGDPGPVVDGRASQVGQVFEVRNPAINTDEFRVMLADGLAPLNRTLAAMLLVDTATQQAYPDGAVAPITLGPAAVAGVPVSARTDLAAGLPDQPPQLASVAADTATCLRFGATGGPELAVTMSSVAARDADAGAVPTGPHQAGTMADQIAVPAGSGVLAHDLPTAGATPGADYLITDLGVKFPLSNPEVVQTLGYDRVGSVAIPNRLLDLLPTGPVLNPQAAMANQAPGR